MAKAMFVFVVSGRTYHCAIDPRTIAWGTRRPAGVSPEEMRIVRQCKAALEGVALKAAAPKPATRPAATKPAPKPAPARAKADKPIRKAGSELTFVQAMTARLKRTFVIPEGHVSYVAATDEEVFSTVDLDEYPTVGSFKSALYDAGVNTSTLSGGFTVGQGGTPYIRLSRPAVHDGAYWALFDTCPGKKPAFSPSSDPTAWMMAAATASPKSRRMARA